MARTGHFVHKDRGQREPRHSEFWNGKRKKFGLINLVSCVLLQTLFLANLSNLYGSLQHENTNVHNMHILMVDYDGGVVGQSLAATYQQLKQQKGRGFPTIRTVSTSEYPTVDSLRHEVCKNRKIWGAVFAQPGASDRLSSALRGGAAAESYNPADSMTYIWNSIRYATFGQSFISANLQQLISTSEASYTALNGSYAFSNVNTSDAAAIKALSVPFAPSSIDLMPTNQGQRTLYNTATMVMTMISQFFYIMALNGIGHSFGMFSKLSVFRNLNIRWGSSLFYSAALAASLTGVIWSFRQDWGVTAAQGVETWLLLWFVCHIHFLVFDTATGFIPVTFITYFTLTYVLVNVTSTIAPLELAPGFYHWQYALPSFNSFQLLVQIWSHGCAPQAFRALPILFSWWIVGLVGSWASMIQKCNAATEVQKIEKKVEMDLEEGKKESVEEVQREVPRMEGVPDALWLSSPAPFQSALGLTPVRTEPMRGAMAARL